MLMTVQELEEQVLKLPISDRWRLVELMLASIQKETLSPISLSPTKTSLKELNPWTQSLIGAIQLIEENPAKSYVDYIEEKYR